MEAYMEALDIWEAVEEDYEIPALPDNPTMAQIKAQKEKKTKKSKAKACLFAAVSSTIFTRIMTLRSAYEIWNYLKSEYEGDERIKGMRVLNLIREFELQKMKETESIKEYSVRLLDIANQIRLLGSVFKDSRIVEKILVSVPEKFEASISALENTKDLTQITLAEILNALQAQEQRRAMRQEGAVEGALPAKHHENVRNNKKKKFFKKNQISTRESSTYNKAGVKKGSYPPCSHCNKQGHPPFKCWRRPNAKCTKCNQMGHEAVICRNNNQQQGVEAKIAYQEEEEDQLFVATCFVGGESNESWLIDSGCTNHMTHDKELFKDLKPTNITKVRIGDGDYISVKGKGTIAIASCKVGHYHHQGLLQLTELALDFPKLSEEISSCKACHFGKQNRKSFPKSSWRATQKLQLIHTDVAGPQRTPSLKGSLYYIAFIDDFTRMCWIFFLKFKSEVAHVFWKFKARVENESGCKIQMVRSDNGKEYVSAEFDKFCEDSGIKHQLTAPYTPQQNGVSERRNRYIMEMTRCMLHEKSLPKKFWAEAANTAIFLQNRLPTKALKEKTPFEAWYGYKPSLKFLKVFGCLCFTHVPQSKRDKLDRRASPGMFTSRKMKSGKIVVSRDVHFEEDEEWNFDDAEKKGQTLEKMKFKFFDSSIEEEDDRQNEIVDDASVRGTRLLSDIYERCNVAVCEPANYAEAKKDQRWIAAMEEELSMIEKNKTWILVDRPQDRKVIGVKWVFRTKLNADGSINKHKARLVVKGYAQIFGVDYSDTFAPVARMDTIRLLFAIAAQKGWKLYQLDVKSAFLNGVLQEEIYVEQPEGCEKQGERNKVYLLKKALYGLKQAPRAWYSKIDEHLLSLGFLKSLSESTLYVKHNGTSILIVSLYVDDLLVTGNNADHIQNFKWEMMKMFEMTDLGLMSYFLGIEIKQGQGEVFICQKKYAKEILKKFKMDECKAVSTPMNQKEKLCKEDDADKVDEGYFRSLIGCLMYLTATRPDILNAVSILSRFMHCASELHLKAAKRVIRYVKGTSDFGVKFTRGKEFKLIGFSDSDWGSSIDDMRSTLGYCFTLSSGVFSWSSKKQEIVAQSTAEAEFIAATATANQALWLRKILLDLDLKQKKSTEILVDNKAAIAISHNPVFYKKTKHFNIKLFFLREVQKSGEVILVYCKTEDQVADILTKPLPTCKFEFLRSKLGVCNS
ncbi:Retrovirus-related Pol polyprotein from transposon TNT 1-94 [Cucumis melo var. makuwa]|uniref:Retrovirus-related Pol polyprotein from transposon TNT 1-94 n=1 Tax=Cucumis melo var. makuwa TaxID=1194695 RepID=A0A5A7TD67_CUCMM|nr:Retrovirus-related Pol polyprotein from transposon TNT 1-94 [Cucumis melo var. makuwa]